MDRRRWRGLLAGLAIGMLGSFAGPEIGRAAEYYTENYVIEQARGDAPVIRAYVTGNRASSEDNYTAEVSGGDLEEKLPFVQESVQVFRKSGEGIRYMILLDNSLSVDPVQFKRCRQELIRLRKSMGKKDTMQLYTVGASDGKGEKRQVVDAVGRAGLTKDIKAIRSIRRNQTKTVLYRSLTKLLSGMDNTGQRTVVLLVTDGEDDSQGKDNKTYQVNAEVKQSCVPVYGVLLRNRSSSPDTQKIKNTRRYILEAGRGYYEDCHTRADTAKSVSAGFQNIRDILQKHTRLVTLKEKGNRDQTTRDAALTLTCGTETVSLSGGAFQYQNNSDPDTTGPRVTGYEKVNSNTIRLTIEDDRTTNLVGAGEKENYTVCLREGRDKGQRWEIAGVTPDANGRDFEITFQDKLYTGEYEITFRNITDDADGKNAMADRTYTFTFEGGLNRNLETCRTLLRKDWWILVILLVAVIGIAVLLLLRRRPPAVAELDPEGMDAMASRLLRLTVTDDAGSVQDMDIQVEGSYFVGRSHINNLYFEDEMLSKQHFVIEVTRMGCYIEDLETKNGTSVNSVRISGRRKLSEGDVITAGRERFVFRTMEEKL